MSQTPTPPAFTIAALTSSLASGSVEVRGVTYKLQLVSDRNQQAIVDVFPMPHPPFVKDPTKGSSAPPVRDEYDPEYRRKLIEWTRNTRAAQAVLALNADLGHGPPPALGGGFGDWLKKTSAVLRDHLTQTEIEAIVRAIDAIAVRSEELVGGEAGAAAGN